MGGFCACSFINSSTILQEKEKREQITKNSKSCMDCVMSDMPRDTWKGSWTFSRSFIFSDLHCFNDAPPYLTVGIRCLFLVCGHLFFAKPGGGVHGQKCTFWSRLTTTYDVSQWLLWMWRLMADYETWQNCSSEAVAYFGFFLFGLDQTVLDSWSRLFPPLLCIVYTVTISKMTIWCANHFLSWLWEKILF